MFNGDIDYVSSYQQYMDGVLSYPLYYAMRDSFVYEKSMHGLETLLGPNGSYKKKFKDVNLLGTFIDNHDNSRFLYNQASWDLYKNALAMTVFTSGIPIIYYGSEQGYSGGDDPANRESLWPNYDTNHELYKFIQTLVTSRKVMGISTQTQVQRYVNDHFYAFSRDKVLVCLTNTGSQLDIDLDYLPTSYVEGTEVCNLLDSSDCVRVTDGSIHVTLNGLPKVYAPV